MTASKAAMEMAEQQILVLHGWLNFDPHEAKRYASMIAAAIDADPGKCRLVEALEAMLDIYGELHALHDFGECDATLAARAALRDWQTGEEGER